MKGVKTMTAPILTNSEDQKLLTLASASMQRNNVKQSAALRDGTGRTHVGNALGLTTLSLDALQVAFEHNWEGGKVRFGYKGFVIYKTILGQYLITTQDGEKLPFLSNKCLEAETFINGIVYWQERLESMPVSA